MDTGLPADQAPAVGHDETATASGEVVPTGPKALVKKDEIENARQAMTSAEPNKKTLEQRALRARYLRDKNGQPRYVFKKGTTPPSILTVMGGNGASAYPLVRDAKPHGFVASGESYFVGRRSFNPWAPSFAGDDGLNDATTGTYSDRTNSMLVEFNYCGWHQPGS